jgi:aspartate/methionine/tyrosine aminotransferase
VKSIKPFRVMAILARARELEASGRSIIHMEIGEPDFPTYRQGSDARNFRRRRAPCAGV